MLKFIFAAALLSCAYGSVEKAVVNLKAGDIEGKITFTQTSDGVKIEGTINGLPVGKHGFHIHEKGDLGNNCADAGSHLNPTKKDHGDPGDDNRHVGDLGNIEADQNKVATINFTDKIISLDGENSIIGRALVVHADPDDLGKGGFPDSKTTGHAGARLTCGVVGIVDATGASLHNLGSYTLLLAALIVTKIMM